MISGVPDNFNLDRIGYPEPGDYFLGHTGVVYQYPDCPVEIQHPVAILSPKMAWKICRPIAWDGQPAKARFRNRKNEPWTYGVLVEYRPGVSKWRSSENRWYRVCETYRL